LRSFGAGLLESLTDSDDQKRKGKILLSKSKERRVIKVCKEKELKKNLSIAKKDVLLKTRKNNSRQKLN
jgi:hypothetical protein